MNATDLIKMYKREMSSAERTNFNSLYQSAAEFCNPKADNIEALQTAGERKDNKRVIDIGIKARRMFTAGMMSHLFPQGQNWVRLSVKSEELSENDNVKRALNAATKRFNRAIEESNFYEEMGQCVDACGYIGTTALYCEGTDKRMLNFRSHYINQFAFCENYLGEVDTVIREFTLTARQAYQQFGDELPVMIKDHANDVGTNNKEFKFIHVVTPRKGGMAGTQKKNEKPIASYYVSLDAQEIVRESGFDEMPYSVGRFYKTNYEKYGRSPATEVFSTLPMLNRMEVTRIRGAERVSNPPWLAPNDGSVRRISNDQGSIIYWNAGNPMSKPEQLRPADNVMINDDMIRKKEEEILDAFYVPLFNPLMNKKNMTAFESSERLNLSLQFLTPAVNRLNKYFVRPILERAFGIMYRARKFPELQIQELSGAEIEFELVGKAALASRQIELFGTMTAMEQMGLIGQVKPEIWDNIDADAMARFIQDVNMVPNNVQTTIEQRDGKRQQQAQQAAQQAQIQQSTAAADAYVKTQKAPEAGSGAEDLMKMFGGE